MKEVNSEPIHFLIFMNNSKAFSSLDGMACSYQCSDQFQFLPGHWPAKRYWILKKPNLKIILITPGIIWSLKFKTKKNGEIVELLIPTLNKIIRNQGTYFVVIKNSRLKIISLPMWCSPLKYGRIFSKKDFSWGDKSFFWAKESWGGCFK